MFLKTIASSYLACFCDLCFALLLLEHDTYEEIRVKLASFNLALSLGYSQPWWRSKSLGLEIGFYAFQISMPSDFFIGILTGKVDPPPPKKNKQKTLVSNSNFLFVFNSKHLELTPCKTIQEFRSELQMASAICVKCSVTQKTYCTLVKKLNVTLAIVCLQKKLVQCQLPVLQGYTQRT